MKKPKPNTYNKIIEVLQELHKDYPTYPIGRHIATALEEYPDIWGLSDKEALYAFTKYKAQLELDVPHETDEKELEKILRDGMNLTSEYEEVD